MIDHLINFYGSCVSYTNNLYYPHAQLPHNFNILYHKSINSSILMHESINIIV